MKETYFRVDTIATDALRLFKAANNYSSSREPHFTAQKSALLVLDMQKICLDEDSHAFVPCAPAVLARIRQLVAEYYRRQLPVIFTRHVNNVSDAGMMAKWWSELIEENSTAAEIVNELDVSRGILLSKGQYDAFLNTGLDKILENSGVSQLVICGVLTHLCCESTARSAFMRGYEVFFPVDGTATYNRNFHKASLLNLAHGFSYLIMIQKLIKGLNE